MNCTYIHLFPYLDVLVFEGEKNHDGQATDYDALEDEEDGSQHPVEGDDAG